MKVAGIESLDQRHIGERGLVAKLGWVNIFTRALADVPATVKGEEANKALAIELGRIGVRFRREVLAGQGSGHAVDFVIEFSSDRIGVELGTGQAERLELDLLKLISLALRQEIDYACLILPRDVTRVPVFGKQEMRTAVRSLAALCSPILAPAQAQLKDTLVIWYV